MKKLVIIIGFFILCTNSYSQWVQLTNGIGANKTIWALAATGTNVFAGAGNNLYVSSNNGESWSPTSLNKTTNALYVSGSKIYAGAGPGLYLSTNEGQNWTLLGLSTKSVMTILVKDSVIFAGTNSGIFITSNNGANWIQSSGPNDYVSSLASNGNYVFAGDWTTPTVFVSSNNGLSWTSYPTGGGFSSVVLAVTVKNNIVFAGADNTGIYTSTNNGTNWINNALNPGNITCFTIKDDNLFAGDFLEGKIYMTTNNGANWLVKSSGIGQQLGVWSMTINSQYFFAGTDSSVWRRPYSEVIGVNNVSSVVPDKFALYQNYPNPFNPSTNIKYQITNNRLVTLRVYDLLGREVAVLVNEKQLPGVYEVTFEAGSLPSGIYFYKLTSGDFTEVKKLVLVK